ncbi:hypothetical protein EMCRGX_G024792 [Ephydatia muelleri]
MTHRPPRPTVPPSTLFHRALLPLGAGSSPLAFESRCALSSVSVQLLIVTAWTFVTTRTPLRPWKHTISSLCPGLIRERRGAPLEVLHTILLGLAKYMLQFMPRLTNRMKEEVLARVNAFPHSGLRSKMFGNVCRYYYSFVGRDFKGWSQMSVFILSPYLSSDDRKVLLSFSKVFRIAYCNYFSPHLYHEWKSISNDNYNQHLKAKALRDTTMQTLRRLRRNGAEGPRLDPRLLGIQSPAVSFHLTRLPGHGFTHSSFLQYHVDHIKLFYPTLTKPPPTTI